MFSDQHWQDLSLDELRVMLQLVRLMPSRFKSVDLHRYLCKQLGVDDSIICKGWMSFESLPLLARQQQLHDEATLFATFQPSRSRSLSKTMAAPDCRLKIESNNVV